jgi:hypothetical protein
MVLKKNDQQSEGSGSSSPFLIYSVIAVIGSCVYSLTEHSNIAVQSSFSLGLQPLAYAFMLGCVYNFTELVNIEVQSSLSLGLQHLTLLVTLIIFRMDVNADLLTATAKL